MDYTATYTSATIRYYASNMWILFDSDNMYLVLPNVRIHGAGYFYLSDSTYGKGTPSPKLNGLVLTEYKTPKAYDVF